MTLKTRLSVSLIGHTALVLILFGGTFTFIDWRAAREGQRDEARKTLEKVSSVCRETSMGSPIIALNYFKSLRQEPGMLYAACLSPQGLVRAHTDPDRIGGVDDARSEPGMELQEQIMVKGRVVGLAKIAYDPRELERRLRLKLWNDLRQPLNVAVFTFILAALIGLVLARSLSRPIAGLVGSVRAFGRGDLGHTPPGAEREDEFGFLAQEMRAMARKLKELDELKDEFVSNVSHDLRNPMVSIEMYARYLLENPMPAAPLAPEQTRMITIIMDNAVRLGVFVSNILDAAKIKAGRMEYHPEPVEVGSSIRKVLELYGIVASLQQVELKADIPINLPPVQADPQRLEQVVSNLISNALKFTRPKGVITVRAAGRGGRVEISVEDTGKGIPPESLNVLFQRFQQVDTASQRIEGVRGSGLGLYIVKKAMDAMQGSVRVASELERGTRFTLDLPAAGSRPGGAS